MYVYCMGYTNVLKIYLECPEKYIKAYIFFIFQWIESKFENLKYINIYWPVSQWVQMNFIFNDNVRILCLSCNVKKVGKLVRFKQKGQKQASFLAFHKWSTVVTIDTFILQSVHLLYKYAIRINFCFIRTRQINFSAYE
jgi:hypothetical protein